ncbi:hypothetical protein [Limosilactobacillus avium]|uniref:hypothetical protein n=1 Tax=Limosilactobacillus avium TaxID=2991831 RepID=UPI0024BBE994|nr:hypothetical protein [Limosilactobacillus avium]
MKTGKEPRSFKDVMNCPFFKSFNRTHVLGYDIMYLPESGVQVLISFVDWPMMKDCGENGASYKGD